ncbi:hypothetical protein F5B22DRAFT_116471 [Xylaria bambusicola]|uniref:uncharacterized protein n=1 Tax=Xylaria bambusicola TaxID=326684 RepID=UPI002008CB55|nr:uncharacterized protein F5B22DRAFT_116471 [Xylaria bambusicola]KAI0517306.1 hypothetical protein F5B22DRAFT_116471 [Xylaria bambusicola]
MSEHVEARSLAALNQLAANPPQYPTKPNEVRQDPLTLYISRVPGTQDIILSTLKPQVKNVTVGDVASSLYYVHFQSENELLTRLNVPGHSSSPGSREESPRPQIRRKPLPNTPGQPAPGIAPLAPAAPSGKENRGYEYPARKPVLQTVLDGQSEHHTLNPTVTPAGHGVSLDSRPSPLDAARHNPPPLPSKPRPLNSYNVEDHPQSFPPRPGNRHSPSDVFDTLHQDHGLAEASSRRPFAPFSLTLIRRDPSSGQQWNVGKLASFQLENPDLIDDEKRPPAYPSVQIHLETSGYAKFRGMPAGGEASLRDSLDIRPGSAASPTSQLRNIPTGMPASGAFERQVLMTYSPSFTATLRQRFRSHSSADESRFSPPPHRLGHNRGESQTSMGSFGGDFDGSDAPVITQPAPGLKPRGYVFYSPWDGRCEFVTGKGGRTLKCRHVLPSYGGGVYNPLVDGSDPEHGDEKLDSARPVSELRFNLPSNEVLGDKKSTEGGMRTRDHLQSQFNRMVAKAQGLDDSDDGDFHFDMSLGREKAGGGNRGKRAKMGKLIIYDEGLKMLDLAVAANVGIWWTTYNTRG